ncbi:MAG: hypothetical protein N3B21_04610 [Clostridia bacterium]|nr:hypothetical protein [Clostridia bacterium]
MSKSIVFVRDLLYPTDNISEPGCIHVEVLNPTKKGKIPVVIENKTPHSPIRHFESIVGIMKSDIFDKINVDIKVNVDLYISVTPEIGSELADSKYVRVDFAGDKVEYSSVDDIEA